jgi:hypothetical protein
MIDGIGVLGVFVSFARDQWPGVVVGAVATFIGTTYVYERFILNR